MSKAPSRHYADLVASGAIEGDRAQAEAVSEFDRLAADLARWRPNALLRSLFGGRPQPAPRGIYIHGRVGRGKTMLMDLFYKTVAFEPRRRIHFHEFMTEVHDRIGAARKKRVEDPIREVAAGIAAHARLLCFDELHVTDIADAMILGRLFQRLFDIGVAIVATSNAHPSELYRNGLNRALFLPFIGMLEERMSVIELRAAKDFRLERLAGAPLYFCPDDAAAHAAVRHAFKRLTGRDRGEPERFEIKGHGLLVPEQAMGVALLEFAPLCEHPYGAEDYLQIARTYHTVLLEHVPQMSPLKRDAARRFINLIDTLYDHHTCLIVSAGAEPDDLYPEGDASVLFERTASRLHEKRSQSWLEARAENRAADPRDGHAAVLAARPQRA